MRLILLKTKDAEMICDEEGRELEDVKDFTYVSYLTGEALLTVTVAVKPQPKWDDLTAHWPARIEPKG